MNILVKLESVSTIRQMLNKFFSDHSFVPRYPSFIYLFIYFIFFPSDTCLSTGNTRSGQVFCKTSQRIRISLLNSTIITLCL